jgi:UDP-hydrolysing UDP-N-acetyl-D-glucosamine 2-epimerase
VPTLEEDDSPAGIAKSMSNGIREFGRIYGEQQIDLILVLGDRYEIFAAVAAAMPFSIPIAHIGGGELTEGAIDEAIRHSITKMSHVHFASTNEFSQRIAQMGEMPGRVFTFGVPSLDNIREMSCLDQTALENDIGLKLEPAPLLVTFHPVTLEFANTDSQIIEVLAALETQQRPIVITYPNADTRGSVIIDAIDAFASQRQNCVAVMSLGTQRYLSLMRLAAAVVGNSSSGIIEAASFKRPVVNIGNRQRGRLSPRNVIDVACERTAIIEGIEQATSQDFHNSLADLTNPYGDGHAAERIVEVLATYPIGPELVEKKFHDLSC